MRIACLHASQENSSMFEAAAARLGIASGRLSHAARPDLLAAAMAAGGLPENVRAETAALLLELSTGADAVLLTCSTLGPAARDAAGQTTVPIVQADAELARAAADVDGRITVLCTIEATVRPTVALFSAAATNATVTGRLVSDAWQLFKAGKLADYHRHIAREADQAYAAGADLVVLGQASMAPAAALVTGGPEPLSVPTVALQAVINALKS